MEKRRFARTSPAAITVSVLIAAALLGFTPAADATFPGVVGKIVFYAGAGEIKTVDPDGSNLAILSNREVSGDSPVWSPNGNMFALRSGIEDFSAIWVVNANGTSARRVTTRLPGESVGDAMPTWSPDGTKLAFQRTLSGPTSYEIFVVNVDGTGQTNITNTPGSAMDEEDPAWSPDGTKIAFAAESDVWVMNADGSGATKLTQSTGVPHGDPSWSPDGSKIAFIEVGDTGSIWVMNPDGSGRIAIRPNCTACELWDLAWSPDGAQIAFIEDTPGDGELQEQLWVMNADGTNQAVIVNDIGTSFDWGVACTQSCTLPPECEANPDAVCGSEGDDVIAGTSDDDAIFAGDGDDTVNGGGGDDAIFGGAGLDVVTGGGGKDDLFGGAGADRLTGGAGSDSFDGGPGRDRCIVQKAEKKRARSCEVITVKRNNM